MSLNLLRVYAGSPVAGAERERGGETGEVIDESWSGSDPLTFLRSSSFFHFMRRFWNQILMWRSGQRQLHAARPRDVAVEQELLLQLQQLGARVRCPREREVVYALLPRVSIACSRRERLLLEPLGMVELRHTWILPHG
ncbi:hypothetical protein EYF80_000744 [Liparis tanakae]|uniref:Uncharacterized protein n=1 Tax=Liparis tanakae TaxID=230148 RepID=A0A4Z2JF31_9TELE|nr:hypothetical protein EYF80_000744 [Liparis tanakae]